MLFGCQIVTLLVVNLCFSSISQCAVDFHWRTINYPEGSIQVGVQYQIVSSCDHCDEIRGILAKAGGKYEGFVEITPLVHNFYEVINPLSVANMTKNAWSLSGTTLYITNTIDLLTGRASTDQTVVDLVQAFTGSYVQEILDSIKEQTNGMEKVCVQKTIIWRGDPGLIQRRFAIDKSLVVSCSTNTQSQLMHGLDCQLADTMVYSVNKWKHKMADTENPVPKLFLEEGWTKSYQLTEIYYKAKHMVSDLERSLRTPIEMLKEKTVFAERIRSVSDPYVETNSSTINTNAAADTRDNDRRLGENFRVIQEEVTKIRNRLDELSSKGIDSLLARQNQTQYNPQTFNETAFNETAFSRTQTQGWASDSEVNVRKLRGAYNMAVQRNKDVFLQATAGQENVQVQRLAQILAEAKAKAALPVDTQAPRGFLPRAFNFTTGR